MEHSMTTMAKFALASVMVALAFSARADDVKLPDTTRFTLDNGMEVILARKPDVPLVAARVAIRGGALADAPGKEGSAAVLAELLGKGAGERDAKAFVDAAADVGGSLSFSASREALWVSAEFLAVDSGLMLDLISDALLRPKLPQDEFVKLRARAIDSIAAAKDSGGRGLIGAYAQAWIFRDHPYGRPVEGDERSLAAIGPEDIAAYFRDHVGADRAIVSIVGDIDPAAMRRQIERSFATWPRAKGELPTVPTALRENATRVLLVDKPGSAQTYFYVGSVGAAVGDPQEAAQDLVGTVFGGRFTSMLNTELRVKSGLTYGARASIERLAQPGAATFGSFTRTAATEEAMDLALEVQKRLHEQGIDAETLDSAKRYVRGQFAPDYETAAQVAGAFAELALYGQGTQRIEGYASRIDAITLEEANAARSVFPGVSANVIVVIGDAAEIGEAVSKYGPVTRIKITDPGFGPAP